MKAFLILVSIFSINSFAQSYGTGVPTFVEAEQKVKELEVSELMINTIKDLEGLEKSVCTTSVKVKWPYLGDRFFYIADCENADIKFRMKYKVKVDKKENFVITGFKKITYVRK
jgi:hypothetical protein